MKQADGRRGAYGLEILGALGRHPALRRMVEPRASLEIRTRARSDEPGHLGHGHLRMELADDTVLEVATVGAKAYIAWLETDRKFAPDELVHPYLAPIAALIHRWHGTPALHGAVVLKHGIAVALIAEREQGKSTTAAHLLEHEWGVLSDDLVVVEFGSVLPGPLSLDLRPEASKLLRNRRGSPVRRGERLRLLVPDDLPSNPTLTACVHLAFGRETSLVRMPLQARLEALSKQLYWPSLGAAPIDLLGLSSIPQFLLTRPRGPIGLKDAQFSLEHLFREIKESAS